MGRWNYDVGNGGDRTETTTPENDVCSSIDSVWGLDDVYNLHHGY